MDRQSFVFYLDWYEYIKDEPDDYRLQMFDTIVKYVFEDKEPDVSFKRDFKLIKSQIDRDIQKYADKIEKRREAGKKGAEKTNILRWGKSQQETAKSANVDKSQQMSAKSALNYNDNDNVNYNDNVNVIKDDNNKKETTIVVPKKGEIDFVEPEWQPVVQSWLQYKTERKESYKSERAIKCFVTKLKTLSNNNIDVAQQIIEQSMANNWQGIFELRNNHGTANKSNQTEASIKCMQDASNLINRYAEEIGFDLSLLQSADPNDHL